VFDKPSNRVRLIDFGCAARYHTPTFCGIPGCWPHESFQLVGQPGEEVPALEEPGLVTLSPFFTSTWDTWCLGLALLKLWGCCLPSHLGRYSCDAWRRWSAGDWQELLAQQIPDHPLVRDCLMAMLHPDPSCRSSASELAEHPLIKDLVVKVGAS
jgi:serine/threonine protein kinase